jgi:methionine biosynthesis protein MetW
MQEPVSEYFKHERKSIAKHIPNGSFRILDVGCGAGYFGANLKRNGQAIVVYGIELSNGAAKQAEAQLDKVFCIDLDKLEICQLYKEWGDQKFDFIVFADVLEHLKDPWSILNSLVKMLAPHGTVIVSLPNVRHWSVLLSLILKGRWDYQDAGIMDRTHLRFFTRATAKELVESTGLSVKKVVPLIAGAWRTVSKMSLGLLDDYIAIQFVLIVSDE